MSRTSKKRRDLKKRRRGPRAIKHPEPARLFKIFAPWELHTYDDGQRMMLLKLNTQKCGALFDKKGVPIGPNDDRSDMAMAGNLFSDKPPEYRGVRDWFGIGDHRGLGLSGMEEFRYEAWLKAYDANKDYIKLSAADVPHERVCYIAAEGPSITQNGFHLADVRRGVTLAVNRVPKLFNMDFDYWLAIDFKFDFSDNTGPYPNTVALLDTCSNPALRQIGWKEVRWFCPDYDAGHPVYDRVLEENPWIARYDAGLNCTFQAFGWACRSLLGCRSDIPRERMRAENKGKTIVLVGFDHCFTFGQNRAGAWLKPGDVSHETVQFAVDTLGRLVMTNRILRDQSQWMMAACYFARDAGIRVINATEGGLLSHHCEQMTLEDAVKELNAEGGE